MDRDGNLTSNTEEEVPTAVTWGVFPGKEIVQLTIVETLSFMVVASRACVRG